MDILEEIEVEFGFEYPKLYKRLFADGMLEYVGDWQEAPPLVGFARDFELLDFDRIVEELRSFRDQNWQSLGLFLLLRMVLAIYMFFSLISRTVRTFL